MEIIKAAVLLGANEEEASKEMGEVVELMENLIKLTQKHLVWSNYTEMNMWKSQIVDQNALNKVGKLREAFPEVRHHHHYKTNPLSR